MRRGAGFYAFGLGIDWQGSRRQFTAVARKQGDGSSSAAHARDGQPARGVAKNGPRPARGVRGIFWAAGNLAPPNPEARRPTGARRRQDARSGSLWISRHGVKRIMSKASVKISKARHRRGIAGFVESRRSSLCSVGRGREKSLCPFRGRSSGFRE